MGEEEEEEEEEPVVHLMSVDVNIEDNNGWTPMHAAAWNSIAIQVYRYIIYLFFSLFSCVFKLRSTSRSYVPDIIFSLFFFSFFSF